MDDTSGYNGWTNYPTWAVNLWLSNDEGLYNTTREMVAATVESEHEAETEETWTRQSPRHAVGEVLKDWVCDELAPDLGATFAADLLGYALGQVDWDEIANAWLEEAWCSASQTTAPSFSSARSRLTSSAGSRSTSPTTPSGSA